MNKLPNFCALGMPWHGLATDGELSTTLDGTKTIVEPAGVVGICIPVVHPAAPGATRNTAQETRDTAHGFDWRDYALLCGDDHAINGCPDAEIGQKRWLYCDTNGPTWIVGLRTTVGSTTITFELWLEGIFGRFGRQYDFTPSKLDELVWTPDIPSWYGGGYTAANVVSQINLASNIMLAPSNDGTECYVNLICTSETVNDQLYNETRYLSNGSSTAGDALVGVLAVTISGNGDLSDDGSGITGEIVEDLAYEGGLVTGRSQWINEPEGTPLELDVDFTPQATAPSTSACPATEETTFVFEASLSVVGGDSVYTTNRVGSEHTAILYKSPDGVVEREFVGHYDAYEYEVTTSGSYQTTFELSNCNTDGPLFSYYTGSGGDWYVKSCSQGAQTLAVNTRQRLINRAEITYTIFGEVYAISYETIEESYDQDYVQTFPDTSTQFPNCGSFPSDPATEYTDTATLNGASLDTSGGIPSILFYHELRVLAPNLVYVALDYPQTSITTRDFDENVVGVNVDGVASEIYDDTTTHAPLGTTRKIPDLRELVWSWQPVTEDYTHGDVTLFVAYAGSRHQYC